MGATSDLEDEGAGVMAPCPVFRRTRISVSSRLQPWLRRRLAQVLAWRLAKCLREVFLVWFVRLNLVLSDLDPGGAPG